MSFHEKKLNVLVANDEKFQLSCLESMLSQFDLTCSFTENGVDAFKHVQKNLDMMNEDNQCDMLKHIHLIILDWNMPLLKGDEACRKIRQLYDNYNNYKNMDEKLKNVPVN